MKINGLLWPVYCQHSINNMLQQQHGTKKACSISLWYIEAHMYSLAGNHYGTLNVPENNTNYCCKKVHSLKQCVQTLATSTTNAANINIVILQQHITIMSKCSYVIIIFQRVWM